MLAVIGLHITPNACATRLLECCRSGEAWRSDNEGNFEYRLLHANKKAAGIEYYRKAQDAQQMEVWKRTTEKLISLFATEDAFLLRQILKRNR
jgi:hypothetical protein